MFNLNYKKIHFIGIGGIGMSALARMFKSFGTTITGSDSNKSEIVDGLLNEGVKILIGESEKNLDVDVDCVVYTLAIAENNLELQEAKKRNLPIYTYAQMLGKVSENLKTIAISGTHGKTTTTAMVASVFIESKYKPHVVVGSLLPEYESNYIKGEEDILITEACEYKRSFLNLSPSIVVITNIEEDHLDYYKDLKDIQNAFVELCQKLPEDGKIICDPSLPNLSPIVERFKDKIIDYTIFIKEVPKLKVIGEHNLLNSACALAVFSIFNKDLTNAKKGLSNFSGTWRRLQYRGKSEKGAILYDDYAHHPDEIMVGLKALRSEFKNKKIIVFFQPHLYSRTKSLFDGFVKSLSQFDQVYLLPIYAAREEKDDSINSSILSDAILKTGTKSELISDFNGAMQKIKEYGDDSVVIIMGAGDIYHILDLI